VWRYVIFVESTSPFELQVLTFGCIFKVGHSNTSAFMLHAADIVEELEAELGADLIEEVTYGIVAKAVVELNLTIRDMIQVPSSVCSTITVIVHTRFTRLPP